MLDMSSFTPSSALVTVILIALAPFFAVMVTSFTKIVVVLSLLRNALGLQQVPPNVVLNGLALVLSVYVMYPTIQQMAEQGGFVQAEQTLPGDEGLGVDPLAQAGGGGLLSRVDQAKEPLRAFLIRHTDRAERLFFVRTQERIQRSQAANGGYTPQPVAESDFVVIIPSFVVRELTVAFQIGFFIFLPFLIVDLVISNILMALGMMMLSPTTISLPFKILLFVLIDGWVKLSHGLVTGYA